MPLLGTAPLRPQVPYSPAIGRTAKMTRFNERPIVDRAAWIGGYLNLYQRRFDSGTAAPLMNERYRRFADAALLEGNQHLLNFLGVGFVFAERPLGSLRPLTTVRGVTVFANTRVMPMATFWTRAADRGSAEAALRDAIDAKEFVALPVSGGIGTRFASATPAVTEVELLSLDSRQARVVVNAPSDGMLLLTQQDWPAWRVYVDGARAEKLVAAGVFRAVALSKGRHEVIWKYESLALKIGLAMTFITALSMQWSTFVKRANRKKFSG
jgi:hypothetical protein